MHRFWLFAIVIVLVTSACQSVSTQIDSTAICPTGAPDNGTPAAVIPCSPSGEDSSSASLAQVTDTSSIEIDPSSTLITSDATASPTSVPTATPTPTINPTVTGTPVPDETTLLFTGVIVPARCVQAKIDELGNPDYPYEEVSPIIQGVDLSVGTFNATMSDYPPRTGCLSTYVLVGGSANADALQRAGFDGMGVATNHIKDCGIATCGDRAFFDTLDNLQRVGIPYIGAGTNLAEALQPVVVTVNGVRFGFVSAGDSKQGEWTFAGEASPGIAKLTGENIQTAIAAARQVADVVIFMPHWGSEDISVPNWIQRNQAQEIATAKPDLVVGNHTHVVQAIQEINGIPIFYGLGNFVFDQDLEDHQQGVILLVKFKGKQYAGYELIPTRFNEWGRVSIAGPQAAAEVLNRVEQSSRELGSNVTHLYRPSMPVDAAVSADMQQIVSQLFTQYLESYQAQVQPEGRRIVDFEIESVSLNAGDQHHSAEFDVDAIANVVFSVRPVLYQTDWNAGNGTMTSDGWVRQKSLFVGLRKEYGRYWLVLLGTGL